MSSDPVSVTQLNGAAAPSRGSHIQTGHGDPAEEEKTNKLCM